MADVPLTTAPTAPNAPSSGGGEAPSQAPDASSRARFRALRGDAATSSPAEATRVLGGAPSPTPSPDAHETQGDASPSSSQEGEAKAQQKRRLSAEEREIRLQESRAMREANDIRKQAETELARVQQIQSEAQAFAAQKAAWKQNPRKFLEDLGADPREFVGLLTEQYTEKDFSPEEQVRRQFEEAQRQHQEQVNKQVEEQLQAERKRQNNLMVEQIIGGTIAPALQQNADRYECLLRINGGDVVSASKEVFAAVALEYQHSKKRYSYQEAADLLEKYHEQQQNQLISTYKGMKKFRHFFRDDEAGASSEAGKQTPRVDNRQPDTLTSSLSPNPPSPRDIKPEPISSQMSFGSRKRRLAIADAEQGTKRGK